MPNQAEVEATLRTARIQMTEVIRRLEAQARSDGLSDEDKALLEQRIDDLTRDSERLDGQIIALDAKDAVFQPPSDAVMDGLKAATDALSKQVAQDAAASTLFDLGIDLLTAARGLTGG
jgi:hypothetical protein